MGIELENILLDSRKIDRMLVNALHSKDKIFFEGVKRMSATMYHGVQWKGKDITFSMAVRGRKMFKLPKDEMVKFGKEIASGKNLLEAPEKKALKVKKMKKAAKSKGKKKARK